VRKILIASAMLAVFAAAAPAMATDQDDVKARAQAFVDAFNKGDNDQVKAVCADETSIVDEFPPYAWHGAGACLKWGEDYGKDAEQNGITDGGVKLDKFVHADVTGDRAYVVTSATYSFKRKGKPVVEKNAAFTMAFRKEASGWRITAWSWSKP
jgi:ketosteroid isomerase-like protein